MQDKEPDGSTKLHDAIDRALCVAMGFDPDERIYVGSGESTERHKSVWEVRNAVLTAIKEAGMVIVPREPTDAMMDAGWAARERWDEQSYPKPNVAVVFYRAMITAGEE